MQWEFSDICIRIVGPNRRDFSKKRSNSLSCNRTPNDQVCDDDYLRTLFLHDWYSSKNVQVSDSSGPSQNTRHIHFIKGGFLVSKLKRWREAKPLLTPCCSASVPGCCWRLLCFTSFLRPGINPGQDGSSHYKLFPAQFFYRPHCLSCVVLVYTTLTVSKMFSEKCLQIVMYNQSFFKFNTYFNIS